MEIAILGGTGDVGRGLALRWARDTTHRIVVGSRAPERAEQAVTGYRDELAARGIESNLVPAENTEAAAGGDVVILAVPPYHVRDLTEGIADVLDPDSILVTPAVGMQRADDGMHYNPPSAGSVTELVAATAPPDVPVIGAFHNLGANRLADLDATLELDVVVLGEHVEAKALVMELTGEIAGLRALDGGGLGNAAEVEAITPLLINIARHNEDMHDVGVRFS